MPSRSNSNGGGSQHDPSGPMTVEQLAALMGVQYKKPLESIDIHRLRKPLPGYANLLGNCARRLEAEWETFKGCEIAPARIRQVEAKQEFLVSREMILKELLRSVYHQRMETDNEGMGMLQKVSRWITLLAENDSGLLGRWKFLREFLSNFYPTGPRPKKAKVVDKNAKPHGKGEDSETNEASDSSEDSEDQSPNEQSAGGKKKSVA